MAETKETQNRIHNKKHTAAQILDSPTSLPQTAEARRKLAKRVRPPQREGPRIATRKAQQKEKNTLTSLYTSEELMRGSRAQGEELGEKERERRQHQRPRTAVLVAIVLNA